MTAKLILIPGLGVGRRLFDPQRRQFEASMFVPDWQRPIRLEMDGKQCWESLPDYAARWADRWSSTVLASPEVRSNFLVGGCSFGGMVAMEAALHLTSQGIRPRGVILLASARTPRDVPKLPFAIGKLMSRALPVPALRASITRLANLAIKLEKLSDLDQVMVRKLISDLDIELVRFGLDAMTRWVLTEEKVASLVEGGVPIHQIHGNRDRALKPPKDHERTIVEGAGHLVNVSHASEVNAWLRKVLESAEG